ncbi:MAG TPA: hypothetical protein VFC78_05770 [Tepidisphaeraceae bacterium]|nr:hypothetical protein [Tepidisphaeraceae bacterium]
MPDKAKLLTVKIDAKLAADYRTAYERAFPRREAGRESLADFIAGFVEDRLAEEIEFVQDIGQLPAITF